MSTVAVLVAVDFVIDLLARKLISIFELLLPRCYIAHFEWSLTLCPNVCCPGSGSGTKVIFGAGTNLITTQIEVTALFIDLNSF